MTTIEVDGRRIEVPSGFSVKEALEKLGYNITLHPSDKGLFMPCQVGGCWACALKIDGEARPACTAQVQEGMRIRTAAPMGTPRRMVAGFMGHKTGGVGTPWWLESGLGFIEAVCFTSGCNLCCPQCQNWRYAFMDVGEPLTPEEAAERMTETKKECGVERIAISGGECTLNRPWLVSFIRLLREQNPIARIHVDTNGTILTEDYIDELVGAGMTDIGIDLKALRTSTFMEMTGLLDEGLATKYLQTAWEAVKYLHDSHPQVFLGIGIPFNEDLISIAEIQEMAERIISIDPWIQVCVLDYRPEFRRSDLVRPSHWKMLEVHYILRDCGLQSVVCQTERGKIGPAGRLLG